MAANLTNQELSSLWNRAAVALEVYERDIIGVGLQWILNRDPEASTPKWYGYCDMHRASIGELEEGATRLKELIGILAEFKERSASCEDPLRTVMGRLGDVIPGYRRMSNALDEYLVALRERPLDKDGAVRAARHVARCVAGTTTHKIKRDLRLFRSDIMLLLLALNRLVDS